MLLELFIILGSVFLIMLPGFIAAKKSMLAERTLFELSWIQINFIYPCLIISSLLASFNCAELINLWFLPLICFGIMFLGYIFGFFFIKLLRFESDDEKKAFHFQCVMNNYSFVPLPLALIFFGEKGAAVVILCSLGAEFAIWTLGLASLQGFSIDKKMLKIFSVPPMLALYLSIFLILISGFTDINFKNSSSSLLKNLMITIRMIGGATIPVAMIVCGGRMGLAPVSRIFRANVFILSFVRLVIIPAAIILILSLLPIDALYFKVISIIAVMPTAIASIVMSEIYGGDKDFMTATVLVTNIAGLVTIPIILFFVL